MTSKFRYDSGFFPTDFMYQKEDPADFFNEELKDVVNVSDAKILLVQKLKEIFPVLKNEDIDIKIYDAEIIGTNELPDDGKLDKEQHLVKGYVIPKNGEEKINLKNFIYDENIFRLVNDIIKDNQGISEDGLVKQVNDNTELEVARYGLVETRESSIKKAFKRLRSKGLGAGETPQQPSTEEVASPSTAPSTPPPSPGEGTGRSAEPTPQQPSTPPPGKGSPSPPDSRPSSQESRPSSQETEETVVEELYNEWITGGNKKLFNIFDLFKGQDKIKGFYNDMVGLDIYKFNIAFLKLYTFIFIKYSKNVDELNIKETLENMGKKIDEDDGVSRDKLLTMDEVKVKVKGYVSHLVLPKGSELTSDELDEKVDKMVIDIIGEQQQGPPNSKADEEAGEDEAGEDEDEEAEADEDEAGEDEDEEAEAGEDEAGEDEDEEADEGDTAPPPPPGSPPTGRPLPPDPQDGGRRLRRKKRTNKKRRSVRKNIPSNGRTQKRRTQKRRTQKRRTQKRRTQKRRTQKKKVNKRMY